jgi:hypothetical protein
MVDSECQSRGFQCNPRAFVDYYASVGWKVGRNPMKDWRSALSGWNRRHIDRGDPDYRAKREAIRSAEAAAVALCSEDEDD